MHARCCCTAFLGLCLLLLLPAPALRAQLTGNFLLPVSSGEEVVVHHSGFSLGYREVHEQAGWVAYYICRSRLNGGVERRNNFRPDPSVRSGTAVVADYSDTGYDRGHLAPAADMAWSAGSMSESFYFSNMSPQLPGFNRGVWKRLEEQVRDWAGVYDTLWVVTGPVLTNGLPTIGINRVSVPNYYYKVLIDASAERRQGIGFVLSNRSSQFPLTEFVVSIDSVERLTGIDFFHALPDSMERSLERAVCVTCWDWTTGRITGVEPGGNGDEVAGTAAVQCRGTTKTGNRCRNNTRSASGFCHLHD